MVYKWNHHGNAELSYYSERDAFCLLEMNALQRQEESTAPIEEGGQQFVLEHGNKDLMSLEKKNSFVIVTIVVFGVHFTQGVQGVAAACCEVAPRQSITRKENYVDINQEGKSLIINGSFKCPVRPDAFPTLK